MENRTNETLPTIPHYCTVVCNDENVVIILVKGILFQSVIQAIEKEDKLHFDSMVTVVNGERNHFHYLTFIKITSSVFNRNSEY